MIICYLFYELKKTDILPLERMAEKSADNIIKGIEESKKTPFHKLLFALGIRYVGETVAKKLVSHFMSMDALLKTNQEELESVDEIGDKIAVSVLEFIQNENNIILINRLKEYGLNMEISRKKLEQSSNLLQGKKIVVSGKFNVHSRDEIKDMITLNGGQIVSSVSAQTNLIVAGENMGPSKLAKAKSLDIEIIGSSSKVPTSAYKNNKELSQKRVNEAKKLLFKYLKQRGADISKVNIISERAIVSGPTYNYDYGNKAKYFEFQYFMISVK